MAGLQDVSVRFFFVPLPRRVLRQPGVLHFHIPTRPYSRKRPFGNLGFTLKRNFVQKLNLVYEKSKCLQKDMLAVTSMPQATLHEVSSGHVASALCSPSCLSCVMAAEN